MAYVLLGYSILKTVIICSLDTKKRISHLYCYHFDSGPLPFWGTSLLFFKTVCIYSVVFSHSDHRRFQRYYRKLFGFFGVALGITICIFNLSQSTSSQYWFTSNKIYQFTFISFSSLTPFVSVLPPFSSHLYYLYHTYYIYIHYKFNNIVFESLLSQNLSFIESKRRK